MPYQLEIRPQAARKLASLNESERQRITERIIQLSDNPNNPALDTKRLAGSALWRLRVGAWRIIYDRNDKLKILSVEKIKPRGDAYK